MPTKKKLLIVGPYPPPYGGISLHNRRLQGLLKYFFEITILDESRNKQRKDGIFNLRTFRFFSYVMLLLKNDIIDIHSSKTYIRFLHFIISFLFRKKIIVSIHSYNKIRKIPYFVDKFIIKYSSKVIYISRETALKFQLKNSYIKESFIPVSLDEEEALPEEISDWLLKQKNSSNIICCANAWRLDVYNNEDLYGLDLCIEAAKIFKSENVNIAFIFIICDKNGIIGVEQYKALIQSYNLNDNFFIYESAISFLRLISKSDIVIRPTNTDGDANTIREGLYLGKKVISSDVVIRPRDTMLFANRNVDSLVTVIKKAISDLNNNNNNQKIDIQSLSNQARIECMHYYRQIYM